MSTQIFPTAPRRTATVSPIDPTARRPGTRAPAFAQSDQTYSSSPPAQTKPRHSETTHTATETAWHNVVTLTSPSGGIGLSTLAAMLAWTLTERQTTCALVDADLNGGGLDVLLGIEREPGLCMQDLDAPLGSMDGEALNGELPHWEQVRVLAYAPWRGDKPEPWEMQAAVTALAEANQMELVDAGRGTVFEQVPDLLAGMHLVGVELSVLGLARARVHLNALEDLGVTRPLIVGIEPRGADRRSSVVAAAEAASYLGDRMLGPVKSDGALCSSILGGLGIQRISRRNRKTLEQLADEIEAACGTSHFIDSPPSGESWRS